MIDLISFGLTDIEVDHLKAAVSTYVPCTKYMTGLLQAHHSKKSEDIFLFTFVRCLQF